MNSSITKPRLHKVALAITTTALAVTSLLATPTTLATETAQTTSVSVHGFNRLTKAISTLPLRPDLRLEASTDRLSVVSTKTGALQQIPGRFSRLVSTTLADGVVVAGVDSNKQQIYLWQLAQDGRLTPLSVSRSERRVAEDVCFYQSAANQQLSLFVIGDRGGADQLLVRQQGQWLKQPLLVRELAIAYDSKSCTTTNSQLLVASPDGLWQFDAEPEGEDKAVMVQARTPFGAIDDEIVALKSLDATGQQVLALTEHAKALSLFTRQADGSYQLQALPLQGSMPSQGWEYASVTAPHDGKLHIELHSQAADSNDLPQVWQTELMGVAKAQVTDGTAPIAQVHAMAETSAVQMRGDVIDDPAIWFNARQPAESRVLATNKREGLEVYDLSGKQLQKLTVGRLNNVDVRALPDGALAVATSRDDNALQLFSVDANGMVTDAGKVATPLHEIYGVCMYQANNGDLFGIATDKSGQILQYKLQQQAGRWQGQLTARYQLQSQPEGCVADDQRGGLFIGEEDVGIWHIDLKQGQRSAVLIAKADGKDLVADVEGMALAQGKTPYLVVSSQGDNSYMVYQALPPYQALGKFRVGTNVDLAIDGSSETDGLDLSVSAFGGPFQQGMLVVQDGRNRMPEQGQNLKLVPWQQVLDVLKLKP